MYLFRDSDGNEADVLLPTGSHLHAIEIKAGATVNPDYFKGLKTFAAHNPNATSGGRCGVWRHAKPKPQRLECALLAWSAISPSGCKLEIRQKTTRSTQCFASSIHWRDRIPS